jgi:hypothetical protein
LEADGAGEGGRPSEDPVGSPHLFLSLLLFLLLLRRTEAAVAAHGALKKMVAPPPVHSPVRVLALG